MQTLSLPQVVHDVLDGEGDGWSNLAGRLDQSMDSIGTQAVLVAGCQPGVGCTTIATALAVALAEHRGDSILLLDADFRHPGLARSLRLKADYTLDELLAQPELWKKARVQSRRPAISVLPLARRGAPPRPAAGSFAPLTAELIGAFDRIVLDAGATPIVSRQWLKDSGVRAALIVVAPDAESRTHAVRLANHLDHSGVAVLGRIVNDAEPQPRRWDLSA
jgi:Mrp family chromosome partitioning ATPase